MCWTTVRLQTTDLSDKRMHRHTCSRIRVIQIQQLIQSRTIRGMDQVGMLPAQRFHHDPRIDLQNLPAPIRAHDVDRGEAKVDGARGGDGEGNKIVPYSAAFERHGAGPEIEIMTPLQLTCFSDGDDCIERAGIEPAEQYGLSCAGQLSHRELA
jgi:hypothetical protein